MLQKINQNCLGVVTRASGSTITGPSSFLDWYLPCNIHSPIEGSGANLTGYKSRANWHISAKTHSLFSQMMRPSGQVYYTWDDVKDTKSKSSSRVYSYLISYHSNQRSLSSSVLDLRARPATSSYLPGSVFAENPCPFSLINVVPLEYDLFYFPLTHSICLLTAYSKSVEVFAPLLTLWQRRITQTATRLLWSLLSSASS